MAERQSFPPSSRDVVIFLKFAQERNPAAPAFTRSVLMTAEQPYSQHFKDELRNELSGHMEEEWIERSFGILRDFGRRRFKVSELEDYVRMHQRDLAADQVLARMALLFEFSMIGNRLFDSRAQEYRERWRYKSQDLTLHIDYDAGIVIHPGLWRVLGAR